MRAKGRNHRQKLYFSVPKSYHDNTPLSHTFSEFYSANVDLQCRSAITERSDIPFLTDTEWPLSNINRASWHELWFRWCRSYFLVFSRGFIETNWLYLAFARCGRPSLTFEVEPSLICVSDSETLDIKTENNSLEHPILGTSVWDNNCLLRWSEPNMHEKRESVIGTNAAFDCDDSMARTRPGTHRAQQRCWIQKSYGR